MLSRLTIVAIASSAVLALAVPQAPTSLTCRVGNAHGVWDLPTGQNGSVDGFLYETSPLPSPSPRYYFSASLVDVPSPCLSCTAGELQGSLDDGIGGPGPDYIVSGQYRGGWFSGRGTFVARLRRPIGGAVVGWIKGSFDDPPGFVQPGNFAASWRICD